MQADPALREQLDRVVGSGERLSQTASDELHQRFIVDPRQQAVDGARVAILKALFEATAAIGEASQSSGRLSGQLVDFAGEIAGARSAELIERCIKGLANVDALSGLANRRRFDTVLADMLKSARAGGAPMRRSIGPRKQGATASRAKRDSAKPIRRARGSRYGPRRIWLGSHVTISGNW